MTPPGLVQLNAVKLCSRLNALPSGVTFSVSHALYLIEASYGISIMAGVLQRLLALRGEGELACGEGVALA